MKQDRELLFVDRDWFQLLLKGCTIEAGLFDGDMSKIVEFQLLLKGCTIEADKEGNVTKVAPCFSCC